MSDVMLMGVLKMPPELWHTDPISVAQRHSRYLEAAERIEKAEAEVEAFRKALQTIISHSLKEDGHWMKQICTVACRALDEARPEEKA